MTNFKLKSSKVFEDSKTIESGEDFLFTWTTLLLCDATCEWLASIMIFYFDSNCTHFLGFKTNVILQHGHKKLRRKNVKRTGV